MCASVFALSACGSTATATKFTQNWYMNNELGDVKSQTNERLVYEVSYAQANTPNEYYSVNYATGTYTAELSAEPNYRGKNAYKLISVLEISGTYSCKDERLNFTDRVESEVYFRSAKDSLAPVYSKKTVHSTSPRAEKATSLAEAVVVYDYVTECTYNDAHTNVDVVYTDNVSAEKSASYSKKIKASYPLVDNEELMFSIRGLSGSANLSCFDPYTRETETLAASFSSEPGERKYTFVKNGEEAEYTVNSYAVSFGRVATLAGKTQSAIYAATASGYRNVMLQLTSPLSYSLGALTYTLKTADFTEV